MDSCIPTHTFAPRASATPMNPVHLLMTQFPMPTYPLPVMQPQTESKPDTKDAQPTRKRKRQEDTTEVAFVQLPRDELLKMTSTELEDYIEKLKKLRPLSQAEQREVKRQRRLIKNREYAHTSRQKKKEFVQTLREEMDEIKSENDELVQKVDDLTAQVTLLQESNDKLTQENLELKQRLAACQSPSQPGSPVTFPVASDSPPSPKYPHSPSSSVEESELEPFLDIGATDDMLLDVTPAVDNSLESGSLLTDEGGYFFSEWMLPNPLTTSLCLLVVLFSFGLFINPMLGISPQQPELVPPTVMGNADNFDIRPSVHSTGRHLCQQGDAILQSNGDPLNENFGTCTSSCGSSQAVFMDDVFRDERSSVSYRNSTVRYTNMNNEFHNVAQRKMVDV